MAFDTSEILRAMEIISKSQVSALKLDKTVIAQIASIENLDTGEYKVSYEGNTFSAFASVPTVTFAEGNSVFVKIPQNDMRQRKIIEGIATGDKTLTNIVEQQTSVNPVGPTWDKFYRYPANNEVGIVSGVASNHRNFYRQIFQAPADAQGDAFFQDYSKQYRQIKISASFLTRFVGQHAKGNYGLIVGFRVNTVDDSGIDKVYYRLDMTNFVGSPYNYTTWSPQSVVIDVQDNYLLGLDSILLFQEDFDLDTSYNFDGQVIYQNNGNDDIFNILVKDIDLSFVELIDLTKNVYYLDIATTEGVSFLSSADTLPLTARLKYQGKDIMNEKTCECHWYKRNPAIMTGHDLYSKLAGPCWEPVVADRYNQLSVKATQVLFHQDYKLVVIYNGVTLSKEVTLYRANSDYDFSLIQETVGENINLKIQNNKSGQVLLVGDWYYSLPDGSYISITGREDQKRVNDYLLYTVIDFYCQVYHRQGNVDKPIAIEHLRIKSSSDENDVIVTYEGQGTYQYDANGDLAYEDTEVDRTLKANIAWKEGFGSAYKITWAINGQTIPTDRTQAYNPPNSMMQTMWVDTFNILHYTIRQRYTLSYADNVITVKITTVDKHEYTFKKEILFLKDGDQGTNGSTYVCAIRPVVTVARNGKAVGDKETDPKALVYNGGWRSGIDLRCWVYREGEMINDSDAYEISYEWTPDNEDKNDQNVIKRPSSVLDVQYITGFRNKPDYRRVTGKGTIDQSAKQYLVKLTITIKAKGSARTGRWDDTTEIHCQYPIDVAYGGLDIGALTMDLPNYVKYTAAGTEPAYQKNALVCRRGATAAVLTSTNTALLTIVPRDGANYLKPVDKFLYREGIAGIKCTFGSQYLLHPVMMYLNTYGNETINGWDGTTLDINEENGHILAPQVGAGKKNGDGTFTGVIMGRQSGVALDNDVFGLFGYLKGISTFGLKEDGTAYIGAAGEGQIIFDGTKTGVIKSGNYNGDDKAQTGTGSQGMKIELTKGHIDAYNFKISSGNMTLDSEKQQFLFNIGSTSTSYFRINTTGTGETAKTLFNVQAGRYYLQTEDFTQEATGVKGKGTKIDLTNGKIISYKFTIKTPHMELDSDDDKGRFTFNVAGQGTFQIKGNNKTLFNVSGSSGYYLQTDDYQAETSTAAGKGTYIDLVNGCITSYNFTIRTPFMQLLSDSNRGQFKFDVSGGGIFQIQGTNEQTGDKKVLFYVGGSTYYLQSANYNGGTGSNLQGVYINLRTGQFKVGGSAEFNGTINAKRGTIGGWTIDDYGLRNDENTVQIYGSGSYAGIRLGDYFTATSSGVITAKRATIGGLSVTETGTVINGTVQATAGYIGGNNGWIISSGQIYSTTGKTILSSTNGIRTNQINIYDTFYDHDGTPSYTGFLGSIGYVAGQDDDGVTNNIGITTTGTSQSIILSSARNIAIRPTYATYINGQSLVCKVPASGQSGIYARFAS